MLLQSVPFPAPRSSNPVDMYLRVKAGDVLFSADNTLTLNRGAVITFDTYWGSFFASKWLRYTILSQLKLFVRLKGRASLRLFSVRLVDGSLTHDTIRTVQAQKSDISEHIIDFGELSEDCMYAFEVSAPSDDVTILEAYYFCDDSDCANSVYIAADICTCRREPYITRNLSALRRGILDDPRSPLHSRLSVYVIDNGQTLDCDALSDEYIHVIPNQNTGGSGGFTRGIMEILEREPHATHILLMDDDAVIEPFVLERTFAFLTLLRPEHLDLTVAGALMKEHCPWQQYEAGAQWLGGRINVLGHDLDMRSPYDILVDATRSELIDYAGWWYSCIPVSQIKRVGLPMPFFIHRDDVEYGLRLGGRFVTVSGICVHHEAFERKLSGVSEYYDLRNMLIVNALHSNGTSKGALKRFLLKWFLINLFSHRYKYIDMNIAGIHDALRGVDWLLSQDCAGLHRDIAAMNYSLCDVGELPAANELFDLPDLLNKQRAVRFGDTLPSSSDRRMRTIRNLLSTLLLGGLWLPRKALPMLAMQPTDLCELFRTGTVIHCDAAGKGYEVSRDGACVRQAISRFRRVMLLFDKRYDDVCDQYRRRRSELCSDAQWRKILSIEKES